MIATGCGDRCQADAGITRSRLNDGRAGFELARALCGLNHGQRRAVFGRASRVHALELGQNVRFCAVCLCDAVECDQRRAADEIGDTIKNLCHNGETSFKNSGVQCLVQIFQNVVDVLDADGQAHRTLCDAGGGEFFVVQLSMGG